MNLRASVKKASRWVLLLYLAVLAATGAAHSCPVGVLDACDPHQTLTASATGSGSQGCPTCDLHSATVAALVTTCALVPDPPREGGAIGESAVSWLSSQTLTELSRGPPAA